jgi:hypothetical protein
MIVGSNYTANLNKTNINAKPNHSLEAGVSALHSQRRTTASRGEKLPQCENGLRSSRQAQTLGFNVFRQPLIYH